MSDTETLARDAWELRRETAWETNTAPELLLEFSYDEDPSIRAAVAENKSTPVYVMERLSSDDEKDVRRGVARNEKTPPETLASLKSSNIMAGDYASYTILWEIAYNPSTPPAILDELAGHRDVELRSVVARNPSTPKETLERLAEDYASNVKNSALANPALSREDKTNIFTNKYLAILEENGISRQEGLEALKRKML